MKKLFMACMMFVAMQASAQKVDDFGIFQHFGANLGVGTEGISVGVAAPVTNYLEVGLGVNFMVAIKPSGDVSFSQSEIRIPGNNKVYILDKLHIKGNTARTTLDFKANVYPFGLKNDFFVVAGFSFGGKKIATLEGHSDEVAAIYQENPTWTGTINAVIDQYNIRIDRNGNADGDIRVKSFRPYLGLGYGRLVPKGRVGFRAELGVQFMGHMKVYQNDNELKIDEFVTKGTDDLSKIIDKWTVYPVLKFMLTTRIL